MKDYISFRQKFEKNEFCERLSFINLSREKDGENLSYKLLILTQTIIPSPWDIPP